MIRRAAIGVIACGGLTACNGGIAPIAWEGFSKESEISLVGCLNSVDYFGPVSKISGGLEGVSWASENEDTRSYFLTDNATLHFEPVSGGRLKFFVRTREGLSKRQLARLADCA